MENKLENYETVKERKKRFYADHPDGSIVTDIFFLEKNHVVIKGMVYRTKEEQERGLPTGVGFAEEFQGQGGFANKFAWMENCDESACGRALDAAGYSGNDKCSREEMEKVKRHEEIKKEKGNIEEAIRELDKQTLVGLGVTAKKLNQLFEWTPEEKLKLQEIYTIKKAELSEVKK